MSISLTAAFLLSCLHAPVMPLRKVAAVALPDGANRFDYQGTAPTTCRLYLSHMGLGKLIVFDTEAIRLVANLGRSWAKGQGTRADVRLLRTTFLTRPAQLARSRSSEWRQPADPVSTLIQRIRVLFGTVPESLHDRVHYLVRPCFR